MRQLIKYCSCGAPIFRIYTLGGAVYIQPTCNCSKKGKTHPALRPRNWDK